VSASNNPNLLDIDSEEDRTVLVQAASVNERPAAESRERFLLVRIEGEALGQVTLLQADEIVIGRTQAAALCIIDPGVSRQHARLVRGEKNYVIHDLGSANGTYVGGLQIHEKELTDGDVIQLGPSVMFRYSVTDAEQQAMLEHLYDASVTDAMTAAHNREYFDSRLAAELAYARRHDAPLSLIMMDVDYFKQVNDRYGHRVGDQVLIGLVQTVQPALRTEDIFCRYGGEEFAVILRTTDIEQATCVAERVRQIVEGMRVESAAGDIGVTISLGCASLKCCADKTAENLIAVADRRLYQAKHAGRNRVIGSG
jgi:two-component system, cell cycle response regulator